MQFSGTRNWVRPCDAAEDMENRVAFAREGDGETGWNFSSGRRVKIRSTTRND